MANKVPCGGFTIGNNLQVVDGELSAKIQGGYNKEGAVWTGNIPNGETVIDKDLWKVITRNTNKTATVTLRNQNSGAITEENHKITAIAGGGGRIGASGGAITAKVDGLQYEIEVVDVWPYDVIKVAVDGDVVPIDAKYIDADNLLFHSPNGNAYKLSISNSGDISATAVD